MQREFDGYTFLEILCGAGHGIQQVDCLVCKFEYRRGPESGRIRTQLSENTVTHRRVAYVRAIHSEVGLTQQ